MAVTTITKKRPTGSRSTDTEITFTAAYDVTVDNHPTDNADTARLADLSGSGGLTIPRVGASLVDGGTIDTTRRVKAVEAEQDPDQPNLYRVTVRYSTTVTEETDSPLDEPTVYSYGAQKTAEPIFFDVVSGDPIRNSAGATFDPPLREFIYDGVLRVERNEASININTIDSYQGKLNSDTFLGHNPGRWLLELDARGASRNGVDYFRVVYTLYLRRDGWARKVVNEGFYYLANGGQDRALFLDRNGQQHNSPQPLSATGGALAAGEDPVVLTFSTRLSTAFTPLGLF